MSIAQQNHIGIGKESVYGTPVAPEVYLPVKEVKGISIDMDKKFVEAVIGTAPKNKSAFNGLSVINAEYEMDLYPESIGHVLYGALGGKTTDVAEYESVVYRHIFSEAWAKPSYTLEEKFGDICKRYAGAGWKSFSVEAKKGEAVAFSFQGMGSTQADDAGTTPAYETGRPFNFEDLVTLQIGALDVLAHADAVSFEYDNGLYARHAMGSVEPKAMVPGKSEHKGKITLYLDDETLTLVADYIANTYRSIECVFEAESIGDASKNTFKIEAAKVQLTGVSEEVSENHNILEIEFEAVEDPTDGIIKVELINEVSEY